MSFATEIAPWVLIWLVFAAGPGIIARAVQWRLPQEHRDAVKSLFLFSTVALLLLGLNPASETITRAWICMPAALGSLYFGAPRKH